MPKRLSISDFRLRRPEKTIGKGRRHGVGWEGGPVMKAERLMLIGFDGAMPEHLEKFVAERVHRKDLKGN